LDSINAKHENTTELWYNKLRYFLDTTGAHSLWEFDINWGEELTDLKAFRFQICLKNFDTPNDHKYLAIRAREIAEKYSDLNVTAYHEYFPFADQYIQIMPNLIQNSLFAIICMLVVALFLIPSITSTFVILCAIVSIDFGVIGFMTLWNVRIDCISMIGIIMSVGFAVDLSAHISYAFVVSEAPTRHMRAVEALETLGWPAFQGAISCIIGIMVLSTVRSYIISTFFKSMILVMICGLCHGLFFLPVALMTMLPDCTLLQQKAVIQSKHDDEVRHEKELQDATRL